LREILEGRGRPLTALQAVVIGIVVLFFMSAILAIAYRVVLRHSAGSAAPQDGTSALEWLQHK
jgi:hypothetical protein